MNMAKDDYMRIVYCVLTEIYETMKAGERLKMDNINHERFGIPYSYWLDIMIELSNKGLIDGFKYTNTKSGRIYYVNSLRITFEGVEFLQENSSMQKVKNALKDIKDIIPGL